MFYYILRRLAHAIPTLLGINFLIFFLFFMINTPDDMARMQLGNKHIRQEAIDEWKKTHDYDKPLFFNKQETNLKKFNQTLFFQKSLHLLVFNFGLSDAGRNISHDISERMWPSLAIAFPTLILGLLINLLVAMIMVFFRTCYLDVVGVFFCIILMSISTMFYIMIGQYLFGKILHLVPISGFNSGWNSVKFIALPIVVAVFSGLGSGGRWYRTLLLEELHKDYVKTARAKGLSEFYILMVHLLKNVMLPILTGIVVIIPSLFMGSLVLESFFAIPGLGSYIIEAIQQQDFAIVRSMVYIGSILYIMGLILTDISYGYFDPRVRLK
jgi:peptide/nickel transport system permease protein